MQPSLKGFGAPRRDQADAFASHRVNDDQQAVASHADQDKAILAVVFAVIGELNRERAFEDVARGLELNAMLG